VRPNSEEASPSEQLSISIRLDARVVKFDLIE
jgi:hypothetical protein